MVQSIEVGGARILLPSKLPRVAKNTLPSKRSIFWRLHYEPEEIEAEAKRFFELVSQIIPHPKTIVELFGGVGVNAQILQLLFNPASHVVYCGRTNFYSRVLVASQHFNWHTSSIGALDEDLIVPEMLRSQHIDLVVADFPDWTLSKAKKQYKEITEAIFSKASWVILTDSRRLPPLELESCIASLGYRMVSQVANKRSLYLLFRKAV